MSAFRLLIGSSAVKLMRNVPAITSVPVRNYKRWLSPTLKELKRRNDRMIRELLPHSPPPVIRSNFLEWNYKAEWYAFGKRLQEEFEENLLQSAFTHRSYIIKEEDIQREAGIENPELKLNDNRELAEKGYIFMNDYIRKYVYLLLPRFPTEGITAVCDYLLGDEILAHVSSHLGTSDLILSADVPPEKETLSLTLKAVVGALLESSGPERTGLFVRDFIITQLVGKDVNDLWHPADPLATLEEILEREHRGKPEPRLINEAAMNNILAAYEVAIYSDKEFLGSGFGETIPIATNMAAYDVLCQFFQTTESMAPFSFQLNPYEGTAKVSPHNTSIAGWRLQNIVNC